MELAKFENRILLKHYWKQDYKAGAADRRICEVEVEDVVIEWVAERWFRFNLEKRKLKIYHVLEDINYRILRIYTGVLGENPQTSICKLTEELVASKDTTYRQIKTLGKSYGSCKSVPHELTPQHAQRRVDIVSLSVIPWMIDLSGNLTRVMKNGCITATLMPQNSGSVPITCQSYL